VTESHTSDDEVGSFNSTTTSVNDDGSVTSDDIDMDDDGVVANITMAHQ
jgi:hypothetical protein